MTRGIAVMALTTLGLPGTPVHEPVHAVSTAVITESNRAWKPRSGERPGRALV